MKYILVAKAVINKVLDKAVGPLEMAILGIVVISTLSYALAWQAPGGNPPVGNTDAPINVSSNAQIKGGNLVVNALGITASGSALLVPNGNVGIGMSTPNYKLDVRDTAPGGGIMGRFISAAPTNPYVVFGTNNNVGDIRFGNDNTQAALINTTGGWQWNTQLNIMNGNVGIGTTAPGEKLHVIGTAGNDTGTWSNLGASDGRLKKDISQINNALEQISQLEGVTFSWINPQDHGDRNGLQTGFIAQNIEENFPDWTIELTPWGDDVGLVSEGENIKSYGLGPEFNALLVESIKELSGGLQGLAFNSETDYGLVFSSTISLDELAQANANDNFISDPIGYIRERVEQGIKIARTIVAEKVVAVNGYFKRIFANELCLTDSNGELVCVTGDDLRNIGGQIPAAQLILPQNPIVLPEEDINPVVELEGLLEKNEEEEKNPASQEPIVDNDALKPAEPEIAPVAVSAPISGESMPETVVEPTPVEDITVKEDSAIIEQIPQ